MLGDRTLAGLSASRDQVEAIDWEAIYRTEMPRIYNFFRFRTGDKATAEELTAATFEKAWRARDRYRRDVAKFSTWLFSIARNVAIDHLRRQKRQPVPWEELSEQADTRVGPEAIAQQGDAIRRVASLLHQLPARDAELIALKYGAELSNRAIAQLTGLSESNVGIILHRTVQRLKQQWEVQNER